METINLTQSILACMDKPVYVRDQNRNILFMNKKAEQITGWAAGEAIKSRKCSEIFGDPDGKCRDGCPAEYLPDKIPGGSFRKSIKTRDGQVLDFRISASPLYHEGVLGGKIIVLEEDIQPEECKRCCHKHAAVPAEHCEVERALQESEEKFRLLLENIEDGFYELDLAGNLIYCNEAMARIYGITDRASVKGMNYRRYMETPKNVGEVFQAFNRVFNSGRPEKGFSLEIKRPDGTIRTLEISISLIREGSGKTTGFRGIVRDITERKQAEEKLKFISMHDVMTGLYNRAYFEEEMSRLNRNRFSPVTIICCDVDGLKMVNDAFGHKKGDELLKAVAEVLKEPFRASDVVARIGGDEFAIILSKTGEEAARKICERILQSIESYNMKEAGVPISLSIGRATGNISKESTCHDLYLRADNEMYRQKLQNKASSRGIVVRSLLKSLDERDFLAGGHAQRIFEYSKRLAEAAGLSGKDLEDLRLLARFHDIGKVGVSDTVLFKTRSLNKKEWEEIKQHSEIGYRIARFTPELASISDWVLQHHEWWNGKGYPLGLKGKEIPLLCRIFAIADAYDSITSDRPQRKALSSDEARSELQRRAGTQFDPELVELFIKTVLETNN
ncbi:MAG: sensor domain-containing diguanylate cyclase/phosphohydrolase [Desulfocucumaceae bacterium]